ncbi:hypothetical protein NCCP2716_13820 [Sporosarcina sp. NCCP-2716]|uniref:CPBP family intramembrane glutamic endopeptidase n=1 Tax=Sporosarcina sp. NCCP-2716 TaxID=2943679 RepID=UPI00203D7A20|nr:CPBP family intramembrane glutamic endopeptidase [Sporosarcina sp. NCCP-2716]GKV68884.1 hypothetical protein NCCP2716_13820 [Sporosarcina sp. NCCP-2716]
MNEPIYEPKRTKRIPTQQEMAHVFLFYSFLSAAFLFALVLLKFLMFDQLLSFARPMHLFLWTAAGSLLMIGYGVLLTVMLSSNHIDDANKAYQDGSVASIAVFMLAASLFEELLFRGLLQNLLSLWTGNAWSAILLTTVVFVCFHVQYFRKPVMLVTISLPSVVFGWLYVKTGNLLVPTVVHFTMNFVMTMLFKFNKVALRD